MTKIERVLLYKLADSLPGNSVIVEIGSYLGASTVFLACAAKKRSHVVYCIDTWRNDGMTEGLRDTFNDFLRNIEPFKDFIRIKRGKSYEQAKMFDGYIDLLFIDGDHSYEAVKLDVELWLPKIRNGGVVVFHDIAWARGVKRVIGEYIRPIQIKEHSITNMYWAQIRR